MRPILRHLGVPALACTVLVLAACGSTEAETDGVASLVDLDASAAPSPSSTLAPAEIEAALLTYVECLRGQGLDVPDPSVDADGNVTMGRGPAGGPAGGGAATPGTEGARPDREAMQAAREACGGLPEGVTNARDDVDPSVRQDAALAFAACLREEGLDVPDPDFSAEGGAAGGPGGGPFGDLDRDDPEIQAALEACRYIFTDAGLGR